MGWSSAQCCRGFKLSNDAKPIDTKSHIQNLAEVVASAADDCSRLCIALNEMADVGVIPPIPWELATAILDKLHLEYAFKNGSPNFSDDEYQSSIKSIDKRIEILREAFHARSKKT